MRRLHVRSLTVALAAALAAAGCSSSSKPAASPSPSAKPSSRPAAAPTTPTGPCKPIGTDKNALLVTSTCDDPALSKPYTDVDQQRSATDPATKVTVSYRYIHGGFTGSKTKFAFYFPSKDKYHDRFFESTYPTNTQEAAEPSAIVFAISNGAYAVSTNNNGGLPGGLPLAAYRANAAAAKYSRTVAARVYGTSTRPRGYIYGASGGAYQTVGAAENTQDVWDGAVPMVPGTPNAIPSNQAIELLGLRVLHDKLPAIADAMEPGGSGDPYSGLTAGQSRVLRETAKLGFPVRGWWQYASLTGGSFSAVAGGVRSLDPTYKDDFWSKPGYEGRDPAVKAARVQQAAMVVGKVAPLKCETYQVIGTICPTGGIVLSNAPQGTLVTGADLTLTSGAEKGTTVTIDTVTGKTVRFAGGTDPKVINAIKAGDSVLVDNSWVLALQYYPRHQVPSPDLYGWNQYRGADGKPRYPQRPKLLGPIFATFTAGSVSNGRFHGKMIMLGSVVDVEAFGWSADWYARQAKAAKGSKLADDYRIYFMDNAGHTEPRSTYAQTHIVDYAGELQQALLDLDAWVATGTPPPAATNYSVSSDNAIEVPAAAAERKGLQPAVSLAVEDGTTAHVKVGDTVHFTAKAELPEGTGKIVDVNWDFAGTGAFPEHAQALKPERKVSLSAAHTYAKKGTYLAVVRVTGRRDGTADSPYRRIQNLARVRVIVG